jgi:hypothetical protein
VAFSDDWADFVRDRRFGRWDARNGPGPAAQWAFEHPSLALAGWIGLAIVLAGVAAVLVDWWVSAAVLTLIPTYHQMWRGERTLYEEWVQRRKAARSSP